MKTKEKVPAKLTLAVVAACLVSFCGLITETAVNIVFPAVMSTFGVSTKSVQWLTTGNLLVLAIICFVLQVTGFRCFSSSQKEVE